MVANNSNVIVCGAGMAGLTAAVTALEEGASVTLIEKGSEPGGSAILSGGLLWTFSELKELKESVPDGNPLLQQLVHDNITEGRHWLGSQGATLGEEQPMLGHGRGQAIDPPQAITALADRFTELGGRLSTETALDRLLVEQGRVSGVAATHSDGSSVMLRGNAVVLATGGFQGNPELLTRYVVDSPDHLYLRANGWSTGDAFMAATEVGASVTPGLETFYGHAMTAPPARFGPLEFRDVSQYYGPLAVAINMYGKRFADESAGTGEEYLNQQVARQPEGRAFYIVDQAIMRKEALPGMLLTKTIIERSQAHGAPTAAGETFEALATELGTHGVPPSETRRTIEEFNRACRSESAHHLVPPRMANQKPLEHPPYVAIGVKAAITFTMGGLAIDEHTRVLRQSAGTSPIAQSISELNDYREVPIPGLFAAGCDVGNVHHRGYIGGLATALTTGRVAGRQAARLGAR